MTSNDHLLELARPLGLEPENLALVRLLPLIYVAWSDGEIQPEELAIILEGAEQLGVEGESAVAHLESWLGERPDQAFFQAGLKLLSYLVATLSEDDAAATSDDVTELCRAIAQAAGGLTGHSVRVDPDEHRALRDVALRLNLAARQGSRNAMRTLMGMESE